MKKLFLAIAVLFAITEGKAQLSDWQKQHAKKVMFYDNWLQSRLDENDADASTEIELGNDFWFRAYLEDKDIPKVKDNRLDIRISCEGQWVTLNEMVAATNVSAATGGNGIYPSFAQIQLPGLDNFWKTRNVFSCCGFSQPGKYDEYTNYGCSNNGFYGESLLRYLLSKIDSKVVAGAVLNVKYELVYRTKGDYLALGGTYETLAEGTIKLKVPAKEKALTSDIYRFTDNPGMRDKALEEKIKAGILSLTPGTVKSIQKVQIVSNAYNIEKNGLGTPLKRWLKTRIVFTSAITGETFTSYVNVTFLYNGNGYDENVHDAYFQCGNIFAPSFGVK